MFNPFEDLIPNQQGPRPLIPARPREPAPQTPYQQQRDQLGVSRDAYEVQAAPQRDARANRSQQIEEQRFAADQDGRRATRVRELRNEFDTLPGVRDFNSTRDAFRQIQRLASSVGDNDPRRSQADLALTYSFIKALDPGGRVTDSETQLIEGSAGIPQQARIALQRLNSGQSLTPEMRQGMVRAAYDTYMVRARSYNETAHMYQRYFQDLGENPNNHIRIALGPDREDAARQGSQNSGQFFFNDEAPQQRGDPEFASQLQQGIANGELTTVDQIVRFGLDRRWNNGQGWNVDPASAELALRSRGGGVSVPRFADMTNAERIAVERNQISGPAGGSDLVGHGATLGLSDEASGVGGAIHNMLTAPFMANRDFDPIGAYQDNRDAERIRLDQARERLGYGGTALEVVGGLASGIPKLGPLGAAAGGRTAWNAPGAPATLGGRMRQGAVTGAGVGGVAGFGQGEGAQDSLIGAGVGVVGGATLGALLPPAFSAIGAGARGVRTLAGRNPSNVPQTIARAIEADGNTPHGVGRQMAEAQANGTPYMLADSGDNVRGLLAASTRTPGKGRTLARQALEQRQEGLAERVTGSVQRDLGPAPNIDDVADELLEQARTAAGPAYEAAYARPGAGAVAPKVSALLNRPSMRSALRDAYNLAAEEGRDPTTLGFALNAAGEVELNRTHSWQTLDYVKRAMDDIVESYRNPTTGRLELNTRGRAINGTLRQFLNIVDNANPEYAAARNAFAGPTRARSAMERGRRALTSSPDDIHRNIRDMNESELEFYRLGVRRQIVDMVSRRGDSADVVSAVIGTPARRAVLSRLFGGRKEFDRFISTLQAEREGYLTLRRATQGSPTAQNLQDDSQLAQVTRDVGVDLMTTGVPGIATTVRQGIGAGARALGGRASDQTKQEIAALLSETDPARLRELARELMKEAARRRASARGAGRRSSAYGFGAGQGAGAYGPDF